MRFSRMSLLSLGALAALLALLTAGCAGEPEKPTQAQGYYEPPAGAVSPKAKASESAASETKR